MSAASVPPVGLSSANGTLIPDIVVDRRLSSGRGKKLTPAQENVLKRLYEQESPSLPKGELPTKRFWIHLATRLRRCIGREYSWLSVKRKVIGFIDDGHRSLHPQQISRIGNSGDMSPAVEPAPSDAVGDSPRQDTIEEKSLSPQTREQTPVESQCPDSPDYCALEKSPAVVGEWTRRALFPNATRPAPQIETMSGYPRISKPHRQSRSQEIDAQPTSSRKHSTSNRQTEVNPEQFDGRLSSASSHGSSISSATPLVPLLSLSPPPSHAKNGSTGQKAISKKRKRLAANQASNPLNEEAQDDSRRSQKQQKFAQNEDNDFSDSFDSDGLPGIPYQRMRRDCPIELTRATRK